MAKGETKQLSAFNLEEFQDKKVPTPAPRAGRRPETWIEDLAGAICDPVIIFQCAWGTRDMIPDWLFDQIKIDRLLELMIAQKENRAPMGTDSEALAYMIPRTMEAPMGHDWTEIYMYLFNKVITSRPGNKVEVPEDLRKETISNYLMGDLLHLKRWIYEKKVQHRKARLKEERSQVKEAAEGKEEEPALQPAMFGPGTKPGYPCHTQNRFWRVW